jgi:tRNA 2-thiocytidine biosynthesis protein TtcA
MAYRSDLESRIAKKTTKAIVDYDMLENGDRVMVGLSGGKDSWALLQALDVLRQRAPIRFSLVAVNVDSGYKEYKHELLASTCKARGWEYRSEHTNIGETIDDILDDGATPCSLCARLRRGVLYRMARETGATKIALGHHADDFIETLLMNLFFAGKLMAMPPKLVSDDGAHVVIRPLVYVGEEEARAYAKESELPIIGCCCPACGDLSLQRQRMKRLVMELEREHPNVKQSMLKALGNVAPRHLLDTRLNPPAGLRAAGPHIAGLKPCATGATDDVAPPRHGVAQSRHDVAASAEGAAASREDAAASCEDAAASCEDAAASCEDAAASREDAAASCEDAAASREDAAASCEDAAASCEDAAAPCEDAAPSREEVAQAFRPAITAGQRLLPVVR